jgi:hypothetical protein
MPTKVDIHVFLAYDRSPPSDIGTTVNHQPFGTSKEARKLTQISRLIRAKHANGR